MSADPDIICAPAPAPAPSHQESAAKTEIIDRANRGTSKAKIIGGVLLFALLAGAVVAFAATRSGGSAASASAEVVTGGEEPAEVVATATDSGEAPAECAGDVADPQLRWYCTQFLPFAKKASADHDRLDRLEAAGRSAGNSGVPLALWLVVIGIGILTMYNTVKVHSSPGDKPPNG